MNFMSYYGMPQIPFVAERIEDMYPQIYYSIHAHVLEKLKITGISAMYAMPNRQMVESMADDIYDKMIAEMGVSPEQAQTEQFFLPVFGRRGLFRDLIGILLLNELLGRRRRYYY
ncbi:MAG: hypothetical protein H7Y41_04655 [Hyphomonadaceae bacterium]|nr:hypothetical protein [Clostridia bacterium]